MTGDNMILLKYGVRNYFCFKEGAEVSFKLSSKCPEEISRGQPYSNVLCVKGANGSGKTNLLKALSFIGEFCTDSFKSKPDAEIDCQPFFSDENPIDFYVEFESLNVVYYYELTVTKKKVVSEVLYRKKKRYSKVIERKEDKITTCALEYKELKELKKIRSNASIISIAHQHEISGLEFLYGFLYKIMSNVSFLGLTDNKPNISSLSEYYKKHDKMFQFIKKVICKVDLGVDDIEIFTHENEDGTKKYYPIFTHKANDKNEFLTLHTESSGTKSLYYQLHKYKWVLDTGGVLVLDEFDINLHPDILPLLLNFFLDKEINNKNAQLIFTTHNSDILDMLGKYRSVIVNKENNESFTYRLDEISGDLLRNDRPISPLYKSGKLGGTPNL
ncbi:MAG: AAA family ATPase [Mariprofundaceae bacterium]|nr:AAA family ATPase [Mariprofundaceae bacterium]